MNLDRSVFLALNSVHADWLNPFMELLSGEWIWLPLIAFFLWYSHKKGPGKQTWLFATFLLLTLVLSDVTSSYLLKNTFQRLRPCRMEDLKLLIHSFGQKCGGRFGFVSSHAANSLALIVFSLQALGLRSRWRWGFYLAPVLVSFSRIYLGVHYPGDILGGWMVGIFWSLVMSYFFRNLQGASR